MTQLKRLTILFTGLLGLMAHSANAILIDQGSYVLDDVAGLEWLKLTATDAMSVNTAAATYAADGWAVASKLQYQDMFDSFFTGYVQNVSSGYMSTSAGTSQYYQAIAFGGLFGSTYLSGTADGHYAFYLDAGGIVRLGGTYVVTDSFAHLHRDNNTNYNAYLTTAHANAGVFMVRAAPQPEPPPPAAVPEPATFLLLGLGLFGLGFARRKG